MRKFPLNAFGCALLLLFSAISCRAIDAGSTPSVGAKANPALEKFNALITFYASFDNGAGADLSVGNGAPNDAKTAIATRPGIFGTAFLSGEQGIAYRAEKNLDLSKPGALAIWVCAFEWQRDAPDVPYLFFVNVMSQGRQIMLARMGSAVNNEAIYAYGKAGEAAKVSIVGNSKTWQNNQWHLLVLNWQNGAFEFSLDGNAPQREALPAFEKAEGKPGQIFVGSASEVNQKYLLDELLVFNRSLSAEEIAWLWQQK